ncbi:MAG: cytochrome P460 family protein [Amphritea sp.]
MRRLNTTSIRLALAATIGLSMSSAMADDSFSTQADGDSFTHSNKYVSFDSKGNLLRPKNYREWIFAGTGTTPKSVHADVLFPDFQNVYIDPVSYQYWKQHGEFPEGTILVKELIHKGLTDSPVGKGFWQGEYHSLSAAVKSKAKFPNTFKNWNYFNWTNKVEGVLNETAAPLGERCSSCHIENAAEGTVFYNYFAVLRDSKGTGEAPENANTRKGLSKSN